MREVYLHWHTAVMEVHTGTLLRNPQRPRNRQIYLTNQPLSILKDYLRL
jgi:hypothetical protein